MDARARPQGAWKTAKNAVFHSAHSQHLPPHQDLQEEIRCWTRAHRRLSRIDHFSTAVDIYADERREERPVTDVTIEIGNLATRTEAIVGPAGSQVLIGQVVLETLDLIADCRNRTLAPRHPEGPVLAIR